MKPGDLRIALENLGTSINIVTFDEVSRAERVQHVKPNEFFILLEVFYERPDKKKKYTMWRILSAHGILWSYGESIRRLSKSADETW